MLVLRKIKMIVNIIYFQAAEIIQQQIDIKPSVKLYCLLGDATGILDII